MATVSWDLQRPRSSRESSPRGAAAPARLPARVYRVRRLLVLLALVAMMGLGVAALPLIRTGPGQPTTGSPPVETQPSPVLRGVVVRSGDTIWQLARRHRPPGRDLATYVSQVVALNEVEPTALVPGSVLWLPAE
jgi:hypothetical protein